ncbi:MAG: hypothetical protein J6Z36_05155 [Clostridia bacterium]|nr:hypothetical protein [Clostridia bacterium]
MFCPRCGQRYTSGEVFCAFCSIRLPKEAPLSEPSTPSVSPSVTPSVSPSVPPVFKANVTPQPQAEDSEGLGMGIASLILGLFLPFLSLPFALIAILSGIRQNHKKTIIFGVVGIIISLIGFVLVFVLWLPLLESTIYHNLYY